MTVTLSAVIPNTSQTKTITITVNPDPVINGLPPAGTVGVAYSTTLTASGGTAPLSPLRMNDTALPPGLTFNASTGVISGTPTTPGYYSFAVQTTDSSAVPFTVTAQETIVISAPGSQLVFISGNPTAATVGTPYTYPLQAGGGTAPYIYGLTGGSLPAGLSLASTGLITGTPTTPGTSMFTVEVQDATAATASGNFTMTVNPGGSITITSGTLPNGTINVPYSATIGISGGSSPYSCTIASGTLQTGLSLTSAGCVVNGTPTVASTVTLSVTAKDASNPALTVTGPVSLTISPAALTITTGTLPNGTVGVPYSQTIGVSGGTAPYSCTIASGSLQPGLALTATGCIVSGTPTAPGTNTISVTATDSSGPAKSVTAPVKLTINPAPLALTTATLPNGTVGTPYSAAIGVTGGTSPYSCSITSGTLQAGLTLTSAGCVVSGTPTASGTVSLGIHATDASNPQESTNGTVSLTINPATVTLTLSSPPNGTAGTPYTGTIGVAGGTGPYSCQITAGSLPTGLSLSGCTITGTTTVSGPVNITVKATDSSSPTATTTGPVTFTIAPAGGTLTLASPPAATVQTPYTGTIGVTGGTGPYTCSIPAGTLPAGLTNNSCVISGTPTTAGTTTVSVTTTDSSNPTITTTAPVQIVVNPIPALAFTGSLPNATVNVPYTQTLAATGGLAPYTYAVTAGTLPAGITVSTGGVVSGTPTTPGAYSFTVTATDSENPKQSVALPLLLVVQYPPTPPDGGLVGPYAFLFQGYDDALIGVLPYKTATIGSFTADGKGGITAGELDANHQGSNPSGATVPTQHFVGTYTLGADNRGSLTITRLNTDGTVGSTSTYAIAVKAPVAPATVVTEGSLIESDSNQLQGTKVSGTFLSQDSEAFSTGLTGSYAFGISGDTPCLPTCSVSLSAGPVAEVGEFSLSGGTLTGTGDANVSAVTLASANLNGTYGTADSNGRLSLTMTTVGEPAGAYPTDYAVYLIDGSHAFIMSTDKHSQYVLLSGSMEQQTLSSFSNASMTGAFVGYENSATNPGLVGATLTQVASLSTATIFQGTDKGDGTCNINAVNTGGVDSLVSGLTGIVGNLTSLTTLLGSYSTTGSTTCNVSSIGRGVLNYPVALSLLGIEIGVPPAPRVFYLSAPNRGYFLETSYAGLGNLEPQTGAPFTEANTFTGTYVYASEPAASAASIEASGYIVSNGKGSATSTLDENVGVGTLNVIDLGVNQTSPYTAPDKYGRIFLNGSTVIYAITPDRLVLLDTNKLTTSPSVTLLY
jgi:hypothetical protein